MQKKVKIKYNSIKKVRSFTCLQKRVKIKFNVLHGHLHEKKKRSSSTHQRTPWWSLACRGKGWKQW